MNESPLEGVRVFFIGSTWAGPMCAALLSDMGAQVIHLESHTQIEPYRTLLARNENSIEQGPLFHCLNRNSLSVTLDMSKARARGLANRIIEKSDVLLENNAPGTLEKWGFDYSSVSKINPRIIMVSISGYGQSGPFSLMPAYGLSSLCFSGMITLCGYNEEPVGLTSAYPDPVSGMFAFFAIIRALLYRNETGKGQYVDISQLESTVAMMGEEVLDYTINGRVASPKGNTNSWMAPHGCYQCEGEDKWITIACGTQKEWEALCEATGHPQWLEDERFVDVYERLKNRIALDQLIEDWTIQYTDYEIMEFLQAAGVAATPVFTIADMFTDPHANHEEYLVHLPHPEEPVDYVYNIPWKLSATPGMIRRHAPLMGEHNEFILCQLCGLRQEEYQKLIEEKVVW